MPRKQRTERVRLIHPAQFQYETEGAQRMRVFLPRGTVINLPGEWIHCGVPEESIDTRDLLDGKYPPPIKVRLTSPDVKPAPAPDPEWDQVKKNLETIGVRAERFNPLTDDWED